MPGKQTVPVKAPEIRQKGLLHTLSEIEQLSAAERQGAPIPEGVVSSDNLNRYFIDGLKTSSISAVITAILSPFMLGAYNGIIPVFGSYEPRIFGRVYILVLTTAFPASCTMVIFNVLRKVHFGKITGKAVGRFTAGFTAGYIISLAALFIIIHIVYYNYLTPEALLNLFYRIPRLIRPNHAVYGWIMRFSGSFITCAYFQAAVSLLSLSTSFLAVIIGKRRTARINRLYEIWS